MIAKKGLTVLSCSIGVCVRRCACRQMGMCRCVSSRLRDAAAADATAASS